MVTKLSISNFGTFNYFIDKIQSYVLVYQFGQQDYATASYNLA